MPEPVSPSPRPPAPPVRCEYCGNRTPADTAVSAACPDLRGGTHRVPIVLCPPCAGEHAHTCTSCNVPTYETYSMLVTLPGRTRRVRRCYACLRPTHAQCGDCSNLLPQSELRPWPNAAVPVCRTCYERRDARIAVCSVCGTRQDGSVPVVLRHPNNSRECVCRSCYDATVKACRSGDGLTFGIELEFLVPREVHPFELWQFGKLKGDTSVRAAKYNDNGDVIGYWDDARRSGIGREIASNVLQGVAGLRAITALCARLRELDAWVNPSCGFHVHIGAATMTGAQLANVRAAWQAFEPVFFALVEPERRRNRFCRTSRSLAAGGWDNDRYRALNVCAISSHSTLEFRLHHGTLDAAEICAWVNTARRFVRVYRDLPAYRTADAASLPKRDKLIRLWRDLRLPLSARKEMLRRMRKFNRRAALVRVIRKNLRADWRRAS